MIDVIIADRQEFFRAGLVEVLSVADDIRIAGQPQSAEELLKILQEADPHVLILSTNFLPAISKVQRMIKRRRTALLLLTDENDQTDYMQWLQARAIVDRSIDEPALVDAVRRVARGELFVQRSSSDIGDDKSEIA